MRILGRIFAVIGFTVVASVIMGIISFLSWRPEAPELPTRMVLNLDLAEPLFEQPSGGGIGSLLGEDDYSFRQLVHALDRAAKDDRVKAVMADVTEVGLAPAQLQELRQALARVRAEGKFTLAYADSYGELGPGNRQYWLASAFEQVWLQPLGSVGLTGPAAVMPFIRTALDRVGIAPDFLQRHEFKGGADTFTKKTLPAPLEENYRRLLNDLQGVMAADIAATRNLTPATVIKLMDKAPLGATAAKAAGLIDRVDYLPAALAEVTARSGDAESISVGDYIAGLEAPKGAAEAPEIGLLYVDGAIMRSSESYMPGVDGIAAAERIVPGLMELAENDSIKAVVVRINSPGGAVGASESIRHAVAQLREKGKYVVVSMGDMAASGGYWIATAGDYILASPATITGSIGVFGGKFSVGELASKVGVEFGEIKTGEMSALLSYSRPFSEAERAYLNSAFDETYAAFVSRVAEGRKLDLEAVDKLARGRVWSGQTAKEVGLVDELGGFREAFMAVRRHLQLADDAPLRLVLAPEPDDAYSKVLKLLRGYIGLPEWLSRIAAKAMSWRGHLAYQGPVISY